MTSVPQVQITARDYLLSKGDPPIALNGAIALVAVLYRESRLSPASQGYQSTEHGGEANPHGAYGIASWNGPVDQSKVGDPLYDRQAALLVYAKKNGLKADVLETQLDFVLNEIANKYPSCWAAIRSSASYEAIIPILVDEYEIPANKPAEINAALAFAAPLAALPPPKPAPTAPVPVPQVPAPTVPAPQTPIPAAPASPPPISGMEAGMDAALRDYMGNARDALVSQRTAIDKRIAWIDASIEEFGKLNPAPTTQLSLSPVLPTHSAGPAETTTITIQGNQPMAAINWKTTVSAIVSAAGGIATQFPQFAPYAQVISSLGTLALGFFAADAGTKPAA